jgi:hypothetical protein
LNDTIDRAVFDAVPKIQIFANYAVGLYRSTNTALHLVHASPILRLAHHALRHLVWKMLPLDTPHLSRDALQPPELHA